MFGWAQLWDVGCLVASERVTNEHEDVLGSDRMQSAAELAEALRLGGMRGAMTS